MRLAHDVDAVRAAEQRLMATLPGGTLMQRAAAGLAAITADAIGRVYGSRVVLLVGTGDNGGDALFAGARLAARGARVDAVLTDPARAHAAGLRALRTAGGRVSTDPPADIAAADVVLDGLLGIGGSGGLRPAAAAWASHTATSGALVIAVDLPSGVDAATGEVDGDAIRADVTVTFGTYKPGLLVDPGAGHAGTVVLVDIGLAAELGRPVAVAWQADDIAWALPRATAESDKYARGVLGVLAGSATYSGAAVLAVGGGLRGGAGMVRSVNEAAVASVVRQRWPEAVVTSLADDDVDPLAAGRVQAWVAGPGLGTDDVAAARLQAVLGTDVPVVVDADGLNLLAQRPPGVLRRAAGTVLTPHAGELARLLHVERPAVEARRLEHVRRAAETLGATVLLKGSTTVVCEPGDAPVRVNPTGTAALATAGSGDVLSGVVGALLAGGLAPADAATAGAYLHGLAGRIASVGTPITAGDILDALPAAYASVVGVVDPA